MMSRNHLISKIWLLILLLTVTFTCREPESGPVKIAVSKLSPNYENWLLKNDSTLLITNLYDLGLDSALIALETCHGLLITGGEDVFPGWYGMIHDTIRCGEFDHYRDTLEMKLIIKALNARLPILGICRGHQILNVALGGTLVIDIPEDVGTETTHQCPDNPLACVHDVSINENSFLHEITGRLRGVVTTNHHQAVKEPGSGLRASGFSSDGVIEATEWVDWDKKTFLLSVQWHPERMEEHPELSMPIARRFIDESEKYANRTRTGRLSSGK